MSSEFRSLPDGARWRVLLAGALLIALLGGTAWFYHGLVAAENAAIARHVANLSGYVEDEIINSVNEQLQAQKRMTRRLERDGLVDESGWRADAELFQAHYPFYRSIAVLDSDFRIRWQVATGPIDLDSGDVMPLDTDYRRRLRDHDPEFIVTGPFGLPDDYPGIVFITPIGDDSERTGYLAATLTILPAIESMISERFRDELRVRASHQGRVLYDQTSRNEERGLDWQSEFGLDLDGDGAEVVFELGISPSGREELRSALPMVALVAGVAVSLLLAVVTFLGLNATSQARGLARSNRALEREVRERELAEQELEFLVTHDPLTGLPNRTGSSRYLERMLEDFGNEDGHLAVMFLDLDQFKDINDSLGHQLGDQLLCEIPRRLTGTLKDRDFIGRHGGDEFLIAARRGSRDQIEQLAANLLRCMDRGFEIDGNRFFISASIGMAFHPDAGREVNDLIQNADTALFKAKNAGRNQFAIFTREMFSQAQHRLNLSRDIRQALDTGQFHVVYQPIVSVADASLCGLEALLRWEHEKGYMVPPQDFIRVAEETGVIGRLGEFAMNQALSDLAEWKKLTDSPPWLAVNISGAQVREAGFAEQLSVMLHQYRIEPELLHLEITEEILIENLMRNRRMLHKLDEIGMRIVVDDFGVGYSSLAYLKNFPISVVKIDRGFIRDLASDPEDQAITRTICDLAADLGMLTVAEGVETHEQLELLRRFKCSFGQGFLFSRPVPADQVVGLLEQGAPWLKTGHGFG